MATAASTALPPCCMIATPAFEASGCTVATIALGACVGCMTLPATTCAQSAKASSSGKSLRGNFIGLMAGGPEYPSAQAVQGNEPATEMQGLRLADVVWRVKFVLTTSVRWKADTSAHSCPAARLSCAGGGKRYISSSPAVPYADLHFLR